jgi:hypothetical protein
MLGGLPESFRHLAPVSCVSLAEGRGSWNHCIPFALDPSTLAPGMPKRAPAVPRFARMALGGSRYPWPLRAPSTEASALGGAHWDSYAQAGRPAPGSRAPTPQWSGGFAWTEALNQSLLLAPGHDFISARHPFPSSTLWLTQTSAPSAFGKRIVRQFVFALPNRRAPRPRIRLCYPRPWTVHWPPAFRATTSSRVGRIFVCDIPNN